MRIRVRFFAVLRDLAGVAEMPLDLPDAATIATAVGLLRERLPSLQSYLPRAAFAVNRTIATAAIALHDGDELAILPPVSGG